MHACRSSFCLDAGAAAIFARIAAAIGIRCAESTASKRIGQHCEAAANRFTMHMISNTFRSLILCTPDAYGSDKVGTESQLRRQTADVNCNLRLAKVMIWSQYLSTFCSNVF